MPDSVPPTGPSGVTVSSVGTTSATVVVLHPSTDNHRVAGYVVQRAVDGQWTDVASNDMTSPYLGCPRRRRHGLHDRGRRRRCERQPGRPVGPADVRHRRARAVPRVQGPDQRMGSVRHRLRDHPELHPRHGAERLAAGLHLADRVHRGLSVQHDAQPQRGSGDRDPGVVEHPDPAGRRRERGIHRDAGGGRPVAERVRPHRHESEPRPLHRLNIASTA